MNEPHRHICYMYCGSIYDQNDRIIENPAILMSKSTGTIMGWGNADTVNAKFKRAAAAYAQAGLNDEATDLLLMDFSNAWFKGISNKEICYILRRAVEFTATPFQTGLCERAMSPDFRQWLASEMQRVPIDLEQKTF